MNEAYRRELLGVDLDSHDEDEGVIDYCECCNEAIHEDDDVVGIMTPDNKKILLCRACWDDLDKEQILELVGASILKADARLVKNVNF